MKKNKNDDSDSTQTLRNAMNFAQNQLPQLQNHKSSTDLIISQASAETITRITTQHNHQTKISTQSSQIQQNVEQPVEQHQTQDVEQPVEQQPEGVNVTLRRSTR